MNVVIQCAGRKHPKAGHMRRDDGTPVMFVADPAQAPDTGHCLYARPDDLSSGGRTWRQRVLDYNASPGTNPLGLKRAIDLYHDATYQRLAAKFGIERVFVLSAGWGLIPATFRTPSYDITFSSRALDYQRRRKSGAFKDFSLFPVHSSDDVVFLGGKDYLPAFLSLTQGVKGRRVVFYNSINQPQAPGCELRRYATARLTNWHYECARALVDGRADLF